jgi:hypothetical protein
LVVLKGDLFSELEDNWTAITQHQALSTVVTALSGEMTVVEGSVADLISDSSALDGRVTVLEAAPGGAATSMCKWLKPAQEFTTFSTALTPITALALTLTPGDWLIEASLFFDSSVATEGLRMGVDFGGTSPTNVGAFSQVLVTSSSETYLHSTPSPAVSLTGVAGSAGSLTPWPAKMIVAITVVGGNAVVTPTVGAETGGVNNISIVSPSSFKASKA